MSELSDYYCNFKSVISTGLECEGSACRVWFLSEVDTWHACSCNRTKRVPHPESEFEGDFVPGPIFEVPAPVVSSDDDSLPF